MEVTPSWRGLARSALRPRNILAGVLAVVCLDLVIGEAGSLNLAEIHAAVAVVSPIQWLTALALTALSFLVVGQYDALFHHWLKTGVSAERARLSGMTAIALAQTLGMGLATGTLARWRCLPELSLPVALKITNYVSVSFMAALGLITAVALFAAPVAAHGGTVLFAALAVAIVALALVFSLLRPGWLPFSLPPARLMARLTALAAVDIMLAGLALWVLLPSEQVIDPNLFFAAFVVALGAGLLSGSPGGVGPFELCLVALLPTIPKPELIAAILCFRLVYYAIPAILAVVAMIRPSQPEVGRQCTDCIPHVRRAEAFGLSHMPGHSIVPTRTGAVHMAEASQTLVGLGDPASGGAWQRSDIDQIEAAAAARQLWPALYKISGRSAATARRKGWSVLAVSHDAWLVPAAFSLDGPDRRQLRRKLRKVEKAGIEIEEANRYRPNAEMAEVAAEWVHRMGGERGFSMGQFSPGHVARQRCFLARHQGKLIAFATFHATGNEWVLDLMRSRNDMPDGTMHALVAFAIEAARHENVDALSLAAIPDTTVTYWAKRLGSGCDGLRRFKMSFAPRLQQLYVAAPNHAVLGIAAIDIALRIVRPAPIEDVKTPAKTAMHFLQIGCAERAVATRVNSPHVSDNEAYSTVEIRQ